MPAKLRQLAQETLDRAAATTDARKKKRLLNEAGCYAADAERKERLKG